MEYILMAAFGIPILMYLLTLFQEHCELFPVTNDAFDQQWPPIDDEEFLRHCPEDTPRHIALGVRKIVSKQLSIPYDQIYPEQRFIEDLKAD